MKNIIEYFYKIEIEKLIFSDNKYKFIYQNQNYIFKECATTTRIEILLETQKHPLFHTIIPNFKGEIITMHENKKYILLKINIKENRQIIFEDIIKVAKLKNNISPQEINWSILWSKKIDSFEQYIKNKSNHLNYREYYDYYIGLSENAIRYYKRTKDYNLRYGFTYNRIHSHFTLIELLDPTNIIISPIVRGVAEYIKSCFFNGIEIELEKIEKISLTYNEKILLISRMLFPTYFFDLYKENDNDKIKKIINNSSMYEKYIYYLIEMLKQNNYESIPSIRWLNH